MAGKVNNPMQDYQEATNQLLAINEQRKSNVAEAKMEETLQAAQNNTLAQAAEFVASGNNEQQPVNAAFNPATQDILKQYGLGQPKIQKTSSSSQQVTKQNITINNKNTTITNNNVQVPSGIGGPVQSRPVQFQDSSQIKFKTWVSNAFAQQTEQAEKRKREYEKRDSALTRNSNKLMKKLEESSKNFASSMNPKNMASSMGNQLKTLLYLFGFAYIAKNWPKILDKVTSIEEKVLEIKDKVVNFFSGEDSVLSKLFGGKPGETPWTAFKNLFIDPDDGIFTFISDWISDKLAERRAAIENIPKPDINIIKNGISGALANITQYLGDILAAILDPTGNAPKQVNKKSIEESNKYFKEERSKLLDKIDDNALRFDINGKKNGRVTEPTSQGDFALLKSDKKERYRGLTDFSLDKAGNLNNKASASISQTNEILRYFDEAKEGKANIAGVATGFSRLNNAAEKYGSVVLEKDALSDLGLTEDDFKELGLKDIHGYYVTRKKTEEELQRDFARYTKDMSWFRKTMRTYMNSKAQTAADAAPEGMEVMPGNPREELTLYDQRIWDKIPKETIELQTGALILGGSLDRKLYKPVDGLVSVTPEQMKKITRKIFDLSEDTDIDLNNSSYVEAINDNLVSKNKSGKPTFLDINANKLYTPNRMSEENKEKRSDKLKKSRVHQAGENISEYAEDVGDYFRKWNADTHVANFEITDPSNINTGDISGVIKASKKGAFYSNSSDVDGRGGSGPMSKHGHGYIPLGKDLHGFMHKCTSGPATFYHDGTTNHIELNGLWWNTGNPKTATGTRIGEAGFQHVWSGTREEGYNTKAIEKTGFELKPGDIMLNFGRGKSGDSSHAQMWNGDEWVSDTYQGDRSFVYRKGRLGKESAQIWRYNKLNDITQYKDAERTDYKTETTGLLSGEDFEDDTDNNTTTESDHFYVRPLPEPEINSNDNNPKVELKKGEVDRTEYMKYVPFRENPSYSKATNVKYTKEEPSTGDKTYTTSGQQTTAFKENKKEQHKTIDYTISLTSLGADLALLNQISSTSASELDEIKRSIGTLSAQIGSINNKQPTIMAQSFTQPNSNA